MPPDSKQTFFLPQEFDRKTSTLRADSYNLAHILLNRSDGLHVFVPIRTMQYLAVVEGNDIWFVDSQAYAVTEQEGGRLITVSWHTTPVSEREALDQNLPMEVIYYGMDMSDIQLRLAHEFHRAMELIDQRYRGQVIPPEGAEIIALNRD